MQRVLCWMAAAVLAAGALPARAQSVPALAGLFDDPVLARGSNVLVKRSQLEDAFIAYRSTLAGRGQLVPEEERLGRERLLLDRLIVTQLLGQRATAADRLKAGELASNLLAQTVKELGSDEALRRRLKVLGLSGERYTNQVLEQALAQAVVDREVRAHVAVTQGQIEEFYQSGTDAVVLALQAEQQRLAADPGIPADRLAELTKRMEALKRANLARLEIPERVRVSHLLLATRDRATDAPLAEEQVRQKRALIEKLRTAALAGEDFQKLILAYSEDRTVQTNKGEYVLTRDAPFVPEFKAAAFTLPPGQISEVVTTAFGYHLLKVSERIPARKVPLEEVAREIRELLTEQQIQQRLPDYFGKLKQDAAVEVLDARYRLDLGKAANPFKD